MFRKRISIIAAAIAASCCAASPSLAQSWTSPFMNLGNPIPDAISAEGSSVIDPLPETIRIIVPLSGKGKTAEEALAKLKALQDSASASLQKLKADKKDIHFSIPTAAKPQMNRQQWSSPVMVAPTMSGKSAKSPKAPPSVTMSCYMTVEWPLATKKSEEIAIESENLKKKIIAAELTGKKDAKNITEEEEEAEEAAQMNGQPVKNENEPQFFFTAKINGDQRRKAFAEAFAKAKKNGEELALAAGMDLGPLEGLSGQCNGAKNIGDDSYGVYESSSYQRLKHMQQLGADSQQEENESVATDPGSLEFTVSVNALFKIVKKP